MKIRTVFLLSILFNLVASVTPFEVVKDSINKKDYSWDFELIREPNNEAKYPFPINNAVATIEGLDKSVLHMKIVQEGVDRWEAPLLNPNIGSRYVKTKMSKMGFELTEKPFGFLITDTSTKEVVADMGNVTGSFDFFDKYLEIGMTFNGINIMGIGERTTGSFLLCTIDHRDKCTYTVWGMDAHSPYDDGSGDCNGAYGYQPFFLLQLNNSKDFVGCYMHGSNARDVVIERGEMSTRVTQKMIGGIFDLYFFYPGSAEFVLQKYHDLVGRPYLPPQWVLGYHQSRFGWRTLSKVKAVVTRFELHDLPLDVVWSDIDYMKNYADFSVDPIRFAGLNEFVNEIHNKKIKWVPIIDAGIKYDTGDKYYDLGERNKVFLKSAITKRTLLGRVWPGLAVFASWYCPYAPILWKIGLADLYNLGKFDGIWLDMNEIANFCDGECTERSESRESMATKLLGADPHDPSEFDDLPYYPGNCDFKRMQVSMTGYHYSTNNFEDRVRKEYNTHSVWNLYQNKATNEYFYEQLNTRPFVLTRANFAGIGQYASVWLGDNFSKWEYLRYTIPGMYNFQIFGVPVVGADMCGFLEDTDEEMCTRWMQMGIFAPFSRNHNDLNKRNQEPYEFGERTIVATRNAMRQKYSIIMYYYTKLFETSLNGGSLLRPLFFEFPKDENTHSETDSVFMIGPSIMVAPVIYPGVDTVKPYLPNENWFNLKDFTEVYAYNSQTIYGKEVLLQAGYDFVNVLVRGGTVLPYQDAISLKIRRIDNLKNHSMQLLIFPDHSGYASGTLVIDDGVSLGTIEDKKYRYLQFDFKMVDQSLSVTTLNSWDGPTTKSEMVSSILIFGADKWSTLKNLCITTNNGSKYLMAGNYDPVKKNLLFNDLESEIYWKDIKMVKFGSEC